MTSLDKYQVVDGWQDNVKKRHKKQKKHSKRKGRVLSSSDEVGCGFDVEYFERQATPKYFNAPDG